MAAVRAELAKTRREIERLRAHIDRLEDVSTTAQLPRMAHYKKSVGQRMYERNARERETLDAWRIWHAGDFPTENERD